MKAITSLVALASVGLLGVVPVLAGDFDGDGHIDLRDMASLQVCFTGSGGGPLGTGCDVFDLDGDEDVDAEDFAVFWMEFTGPAESVPTAEPLPGTSRPWEAGMGVGTGTSVNLRSGNLLTVIPILGWSGRGPALSVGLVHNSGGVGQSASFGAGFDLGAGWTLSYGGYVIDSGSEAVVIDDDGTRTTYTLVGEEYFGPPGVYATLEKIDGVGWHVVYKDQTRREYDTTGRLTKEVDASGNELLIHRDGAHDQRIYQIEDAPGRTVTFSFDGQERLETITDPGIGRSWTLVYAPISGWLSEVRSPLYNPAYPNEHVWKFLYDADGRIVSLADKAGDAFTYQYGSGGRLLRVYDPGEFGDQFQRLAYTAHTGGGPQEPYQKTHYFDRRGNAWTLWFDANDNLYRYANPLDEQTQLERYPNREVQRYTDPMGRYWDYTYDVRGNLTDVIDQYSRGAHRAYDALNNLTGYTDGIGHTWTLEYNDANNPTSVTDVYAPATGGRGSAHTQLQYYGPVEPTWNGMLDPRPA